MLCVCERGRGEGEGEGEEGGGSEMLHATIMTPWAAYLDVIGARTS